MSRVSADSLRYTVEEFEASPHAETASFDSLLFAHVLEHMDRDSDIRLLQHYLPYLEPAGRVCLITPQERGYASDATHVQFVDFTGLRSVAAEVKLEVERAYSFPFPRLLGKVFTYNEFVLVAHR